jgi:hypothetical protein
MFDLSRMCIGDELQPAGLQRPEDHCDHRGLAAAAVSAASKDRRFGRSLHRDVAWLDIPAEPRLR